MEHTFLKVEDARGLVETYMDDEGAIRTTQEILDSGAVPKLKGYVVRPGKVSDSIFGGEGSFTRKDGTAVYFGNPPLDTADGVPVRIMVRTDRISTHDILRGSIPFKDQILALNHNYMRKIAESFIGTSQFNVQGLGDNSVVIAAENLQQIGFENVIRAYMAKSSTSTSLYQHFVRGERTFCGHELPNTLIVNGPLPYVMDTPSTKSDKHDESLAPEELFKRGICSPAAYNRIRNGTLVAFGAVAQFLRARGLLLVDTKTEHGINKKGEVVSQDELYTMDSSRFWLLEDYVEQMVKLAAGEISELSPVSYSKEFARWFSEGEKGYTAEQRREIAVRYIEGIQALLGREFEPDMRGREERVVSGLQTVVGELAIK